MRTWPEGMPVLEIFNKALDMLGHEPLYEEDLEKGGEGGGESQTAHTLGLWLGDAVEGTVSAFAWPFLESQPEMGDDMGPRRGYAHSYPIGAHAQRITWAEGDHWQLSEGLLLTDSGSDCRVIPRWDEIDWAERDIPVSFWTLCSIRLAEFAAMRMSPDDRTRAYIASMWKSELERMMENELMGGARYTYGE